MYTNCLIALAFGIAAILFLKPVNGLTADGVHLIAVLVPTIWLWITVGTDWVSLLALMLLVMTGVMGGEKNYFANVYAGSMGNFIIITITWCF